MTYTVDQTHIRQINQRVILDSIYHTETISRAALSRQVNISKSAMTENISNLLQIGIIQEAGEGKSASIGGRRPILLRFNKSFQYIAAVDLNFEDPVFVLANLSGEIQNRFTIKISPKTAFETRLNLMRNAISTLIASQDLAQDGLALIAISSPGVYQPNQKEFRANDQFTNWKIPELASSLEAFFNTQVLVVNDVNAAAVGEYTYGVGKGAKNLVYISCGLGLGAGIVLNKNLYEGSCKGAGEIANFRASNNLPLEKQINLSALFSRIHNQAPEETRIAVTGDDNEISFKKVIEAWETDDPFIRQCIADIARHLGFAICNIVSLLDCDLVILGGEYRVFSDQMLPIINSIITESSFRPVPALASSLSHDSGVYGLFALANEIIFDRLCSATSRSKMNRANINHDT